MLITNAILRAYLNCDYKAFLTLRGERGQPHDIDVLHEQRRDAYFAPARSAFLRKSKLADAANIPTVTLEDLAEGPSVLLGGTVRHDLFSFRYDALKRIDGQSRLGTFLYVPVLFDYGTTVREEQRCLLAFGGFVLGELQGTVPPHGIIVFGSDCTIKSIRLATIQPRLRAILDKLGRFAVGGPPPALFLNDHCAQCEFMQRCREQAVAQDHLSLLGKITPTKTKHLGKHGIFSVHQLSHTYHPRRRSNRVAAKNPHSFSLQALALREKQVFVLEPPTLAEEPIRIFCDMEGIDNGRFVYLIGLTIHHADTMHRLSFWANAQSDEQSILEQLLDVVAQYRSFAFYHYGTYETDFLKRMRKHTTRPDLVDAMLAQSVNVLSLIYSKVYFPTYSNSLKEIASVLGFRWSSPNASGLQSLVWRARWEETGDEATKAILVQYNLDDCIALGTVTDFLRRIGRGEQAQQPRPPDEAGPHANVSWVNALAPPRSDEGWRNIDFVLPNYDLINKCAYFDYQRDRVFLRTNDRLKEVARERRKAKKRLRVSERVFIPHDCCPHCGGTNLVPRPGKTFSCLAFDLKITTSGLRRHVIQYEAQHARCNECQRVFAPIAYRRRDMCRHSLKAWIMYQHIAHQTGIPRINAMCREFFGLHIDHAYVHMMKAVMAVYYRDTYAGLLRKLVAGHVIHVDETEIKLKRGKGYVVTLASMEDVIYLYRPTREVEFLRTMLAGFNGVLVSDFYPAYDGLPFKQQKCLVHLIRDLNNDLVRNPFDHEFKRLAQGFGTVVRQIVETIDRFGLRATKMARHKKGVERFFDVTCGNPIASEVAERYRVRFLKNRHTLFPFLEHDGVPWNNNNAEHAIKEFAHYRTLADGLMSESGLNDYLVLLSVCVTCKYKGISFFRFLLSQATEIDRSAVRTIVRRPGADVELYPPGFPTRYPRKTVGKRKARGKAAIEVASAPTADGTEPNSELGIPDGASSDKPA